MSTSVSWPTIGGTSYSVPATGELNWQALSSFLIALGTSAQSVVNTKMAVRIATTSPVTVATTTDTIVITNLAAPGAVLVNLPAGITGQVFMIVDGKGDAATNNITIDPNSTELINGASTYVINTNRAGVVIGFNGVSWTILAEFNNIAAGTIPRSKIAAGTPDQVVINDGSGNLSSEAQLAKSRGGTGADNSAVTFPSTGVVTTNAGTATLTGKTIDGDDNTVQDLAITTLKTVLGNANKALVFDGSGVPTAAAISLTTNVTGTLPIANGGTGQTTKAPAFNALSPLTTKGDAIVFDGTNNIRVGVGTDGQLLTADSAQTSGVAWSTPSALSDSIVDRKNLGLLTSVAASALTIALKIKDGSTNPSVGSAVAIDFRSSTLTSGLFVTRSVTAALSIVVPSGATLGQANNDSYPIYLYALDNAGTVELAVSSSLCNTLGNGAGENGLITTTAISGGATSRTTFYSTTGRTNVAYRYIGKLYAPQTTAGTWAANANEVDLNNLGNNYSLPESPGVVSCPNAEVWLNGSNGYGSTNTKIRRFSTAVINSGRGIVYADSATLGGSFTIVEPGVYSIYYQDMRVAGSGYLGLSLNGTQLTTNINAISTATLLGYVANPNGGDPGSLTITCFLNVGDIIRAQTDGNIDGTSQNTMFHITQCFRTRI